MATGAVGALDTNTHLADALRRSEKRFERPSESGVVGIVFGDLNGRVQDANDAYLKMLGYTREELVAGRINWSEITPPEWHGADNRAVAQLSVILSYSDLFIGDLEPGDPMREDLEAIREAGRRAADLTRQLLLFSRQQILQPKVLNLGDILMGMKRMLGRIVGEDVELALPSGPPGRVRVDPTSIEQVVMNLVVNARDAMPTGGTLTIDTSEIVLEAGDRATQLGLAPGAYAVLRVADTGMGMDRATQARIFEPFFTTKEKGKGTGLGLSTVFGIAHQSGGSVRVISEPGQGATFEVYLPRVDGPAEEDSVPKIALSRQGSETILLVEDEEEVRIVARGILERQGYHVLDAHNAGEALLQCEKHVGPIHLLLSDVVMPMMSGPELASRLMPLRPEMQFLCMSGYTDDSVVRHGLMESRLAFLQKPFTPDTLTQKVRSVLDRVTRPGRENRDSIA